MTIDVESIAPTVLIAQAHVRASQRLSPALVRVTLESAAFTDLGVEGFDTRFKLVLPGPTGQLPSVATNPEDWYAQWMAMPPHNKSPMRTYTIRDVLEEDGERLLVVDLVVHEDGPQGPACRWALTAHPGDAVQVITPHRAAEEYGGTEFGPGARNNLLLVADETALPALSRILADLAPGYTGHAFVEVPTAADVLDLTPPEGIDVTWVIRRDTPHGRALVEAVRRHLGLGPLDPTTQVPTHVTGDLDIDVWETPRHSAAGEPLHTRLPRTPRHDTPHDLYAWIAGESWMVKALRRSLVTELGMDRGDVAFMGYWKQGVAMRS